MFCWSLIFEKKVFLSLGVVDNTSSLSIKDKWRNKTNTEKKVAILGGRKTKILWPKQSPKEVSDVRQGQNIDKTCS